MSLLQSMGKSKKKFPSQTGDTLYAYLPDGVGFVSSKAASIRTIYFPLCGVDAKGLKSSITPQLGGDIKIDKNCYLTKPVSVEDLRNGLRNFFCFVKGHGIVSLVDGDEKDTSIECGMLWHKLNRSYKDIGLEIESLNFIPVSGENIELMRVTVKNTSKEKRTITPTFSIPIFGRALANKHDHEHVTSLLHRIEQMEHGVCVKPTMIFDERGHQSNDSLYYVLGITEEGDGPIGTFPTVESFYGESGDISRPRSIINNVPPKGLSKENINGKEAVGALRYEDKELAPGASFDYFMVFGVDSNRETMREAFDQFNSPEKFKNAFEKNKTYWAQKAQTIQFSTGDETYNSWMRWVTLQPVLRRIFGCSFLPEHDYGKGGKGWRDIWQDLLSLILIEPENIRKILINNFAGVRIDGSNATIIGAGNGEFCADRNAISRVWMDHGAWPLATLLLYINQTGDFDILFEESTYFRDAQLSRTYEKDYSWTSEYGNLLKDQSGEIYYGSIIEHILIENLVQFFNVGEHNITRLEDADWNDGLDMAKERGESVAFMSFYGGNFLALADLLEKLSAVKSVKEISLALEIKTLLDSLADIILDYEDARLKKKLLFETYFPSVQPELSGEKAMVPIKEIADDLRRKGKWIFSHIRKNETIIVEHKNNKNSWFNGYYDNQGTRVEGKRSDRIRMTLVGQVFPLMSGLANEKETEEVIRSTQKYLQDKKLGGFRLNTDFNVPHYMGLGRAFGFAYGTKENGAFFSHMNVMYAYALYKRGFVREGFGVLQSIYHMCMDTENSKIYPGIPEYFNSEGRGFYHYLTGAASWLVLTQLTQVFGIRGENGDLLLEPKLVKEEFHSKTAIAATVCSFAGKKISIRFENPQKLDYGSYEIKELYINEKAVFLQETQRKKVKIPRNEIENISTDCTVRVVLDRV